MKQFSKLVAVVFAVTLAGCATGLKSYQRGEYDRAVHEATGRLKSSPDNEKAGSALQLAYPEAERWHLENIRAAKSSPDPLRDEVVLNEYLRLQRLAEAIRSTPAALRLFPNPNSYTDEVYSSRQAAAETRVRLGDEQMGQGNRAAARAAVDHYRKADKLVPGVSGVASKLTDAMLAATLHVVVNPVKCSNRQLDTKFFENRLQVWIREYRPSAYVRFYSAQEASQLGIQRPDHIVDLSFEEFLVGKTVIKESTENHVKNDVVVGKTRSNPPQEVIGTVKAKATVWHKKVESKVQLTLKIADGATSRAELHKKLPGKSVWESQWGSFNGDERAIPDKLKPIMERKQQEPPPYQELFTAVVDPLFRQATDLIRKHYSRYR
jgi:hypothetical protein